MSDGYKKTDIAALHRMIDALSDAIGPIVTAHAEAEHAHAEKLEAQVTLVDGILKLAAETVLAVGTRPKISEVMGYLGTDPNHQLASWRGLVLTCRPREALSRRGLEPTQAATGANGGFDKGTYSGNHVFLREDGRLTALFYEGSWNKNTEHGLYDQWRATESEISIETFCRDWASDADPKKLAEQLCKFIERAGDRHKAIEKARALTDKYRAITKLL